MFIKYQYLDVSHANAIIRIESTVENFNGESDIAIRAIDNDSSIDKFIFKLVVHPVNDSPNVTVSGDVDLMMNNPNYPNDINIPIFLEDVEESSDNLTLIEASLIDGKSDEEGSYCWRIKKAVEFINGENYKVPAFIKEPDGWKQVIPDNLITNEQPEIGLNYTDLSCSNFDYCSTLCYSSFGFSKFISYIKP